MTDRDNIEIAHELVRRAWEAGQELVGVDALTRMRAAIEAVAPDIAAQALAAAPKAFELSEEERLTRDQQRVRELEAELATVRSLNQRQMDLSIKDARRIRELEAAQPAGEWTEEDAQRFRRAHEARLRLHNGESTIESIMHALNECFPRKPLSVRQQRLTSEVRATLARKLEAICDSWPKSAWMSKPYRQVAALVLEIRESLAPPMPAPAAPQYVGLSPAELREHNEGLAAFAAPAKAADDPVREFARRLIEELAPTHLLDGRPFIASESVISTVLRLLAARDAQGGE